LEKSILRRILKKRSISAKIKFFIEMLLGKINLIFYPSNPKKMIENNKRNVPECDESAVWVHLTQKGEKFLAIKVVIEGKEYRTVAFRNKNKKSEKGPDFFFVNKKKEEPNDDLI